jgi:hypothetical protein
MIHCRFEHSVHAKCPDSLVDKGLASSWQCAPREQITLRQPLCAPQPVCGTANQLGCIKRDLTLALFLPVELVESDFYFYDW